MSNEFKSRLRICSKNLHTESIKKIPDFKKVSSETEILFSYAQLLNLSMAKENDVEFSPIITLLERIKCSLDIILENESIDIQTKITEDRNAILHRIQLLTDRQLDAENRKESIDFGKLDDLLEDEDEE